MPYLLQTDEDGTTSFSSQNPNGKYVVVRKGYEHPEIVMKIVSVLFDDLSFGTEEGAEMEQYYQDNVDPTARPLAINVDYKDALNRCYQSLQSALSGNRSVNQLNLLEGAYYQACKAYQDNRGQEKSWENWAAYTSRITACGVLNRSKTREVASLFFGETESMKSLWWKLEKLEKESYLKIVTGQEPLEYFDQFVREWEQQGGKKITEEVEQEVASNE